MTFDNSGWAIDGPQIPSALARRALFVASSGNEGIVLPGDLKVAATGSASGSIQIAGGAALVLCRSGGGAGQSYTVHNSGIATLAINPTAGAARSDLVIVKVRDPEFAPWDPPPAGTEDSYQYIIPDVIYDVPNDTTNFEQLGLDYSAYALARIDRPSGTGIITTGQIADLRHVANPRMSIQGLNVTCTGSDPLNALPAFTWENFPDTAHFSVNIPSWATRCLVQGFIEGLDILAPGLGGLRLNIGSELTFDVTNIQTTGSAGRASYNVGGYAVVPEDMRGHTRNIQLEGRLANDGSAGMLKCSDGQTGFQVTVTFTESAE